MIGALIIIRWALRLMVVNGPPPDGWRALSTDRPMLVWEVELRRTTNGPQVVAGTYKQGQLPSHQAPPLPSTAQSAAPPALRPALLTPPPDPTHTITDIALQRACSCSGLCSAPAALPARPRPHPDWWSSGVDWQAHS